MSNWKRLLGGVGGALLAAAWTPIAAMGDSDVIGFWDFKDGTAGASVETVAAAVGNWSGTAYRAGNGALPTCSDACPKAVIFTDSSRNEVLVANPKSLHFYLGGGSGLGGYVDIEGLSTELTSHSEFTVEFFARLDDDSGSPWTEPLAFRTADRYANVTFGQGAGLVNMMKFGFLDVDNPGVGPVTTGQISQKLLDEWVHVAFVYEQTDAATHSGTLECYVNRVSKGTLAYTNTPLGEVSQPLRLGTSFGNNRIARSEYNFRGDICALRVKSVALDKSGFMLEDKYNVPQGTMLGFWDFKDGAVDASANSVTNKGSLAILAPGVGSFLSNSSNDTGKTPVFSDDVPGRYIYPSSVKTGRRLVDNPQSLLFTTQNAGTSVSEAYASVGGGIVNFPELGSAITAQSSYTIECFFKDEDWSEWQWSSGLFGFYAIHGNGDKTNVQAVVSSVKSDKTSWDIKVDPSGATYNKSSTWKDGKWHHLAVVYDGSSSPSTMSLYVDYALGQTVPYESRFCLGEPFVLGARADKRGTYAFRGKVSCLRITAAALGPDDFMLATATPPGLMIMLR